MDAPGRVHPAFLFILVYLSLAGHRDAQSLPSQQAYVSIASEGIRPVVEVVAEVAQDITNDLRYNVHPRHRTVFFFSDMAVTAREFFVHQVLLKGFSHVQVHVFSWIPGPPRIVSLNLRYLFHDFEALISFIFLESVVFHEIINGRMPFLLIKDGELLVDIDYTHVKQYLIEMSILQVVDLAESHRGFIRLLISQLGLLAELFHFQFQDLLVSLRIGVGQLV